jgi:hypothetical protein
MLHRPAQRVARKSAGRLPKLLRPRNGAMTNVAHFRDVSG